MSISYNRVRIAGSCILAAFFAWVAAFAGRDASPKPQTLLIFAALAVVFARVLLWIFRRGDAANADSARRRYDNNEIPLGGKELDGSSSEEATVNRQPASRSQNDSSI
jgi:hypothetical protein